MRLPGPVAVLGWTAAAMIAAALLFLVAFAVDGRVLLGENVWQKPLRFAVSLAVYA